MIALLATAMFVGIFFGVCGLDAYQKHRKKKRYSITSKTPYDYALTNAINERDRLQDELRTIQALKRTEADTERIRNEIGTILSDDGGEAAESVYGGLNGIPIVQHSDGTISPITWDNRISSGEMVDNISKAVARVYGTNVREDDAEDERLTEDDVERSLIKEIANKAVENLELTLEVAKEDGADSEEIRKALEKAAEETGDNTKKLRRDLRRLRKDGI